MAKVYPHRLAKLASAFAFVDVSVEDAKVYPHRETGRIADACLDKTNSDQFTLEEDKGKGEPFELYKRRTTVVVRRNLFLNVVCGALSEYKYMGLNQRADLILACSWKGLWMRDQRNQMKSMMHDALAMQDIPESGYASDDEEFVSKMDSHKMVSSALGDQINDNDFHDLFETKTEPLSESLKHATLTSNTERRVLPPSVGHRYRKLSPSMPSFGKRGASTTTTNEALPGLL